MKRETMKLTDDITVQTYPFSDYITCVEVYMNGRSLNAFCSDNSMVEEWKENPEVLLELCREHRSQNEKWEVDEKAERMKLDDEFEIETYVFSEDIHCVNVYQHGKFVSSFCSEKNAIEEMQEDPEILLDIVKSSVSAR